MSRKEILVVVVIAFVVGSIGSIFVDKFVLPKLTAFSGLGFLKDFQSDTPIIINRREQVVLDDGINTVDLTKQAQGFTVSIYSKENIKLLGTGIIATSDGVVLTSREVVGDAPEVMVVINDGRSFPGLVRAMDRKSEIAVVTIASQGLAIAPFEDANNAQTAQRVLALGKSTTAFNRQFASGMITKSVGSFGSLEQINNTEQLTETFLVSGNLTQEFAGGPVFNLEGRVLGMVASVNGKIITSEGLNQALGSYLSSGKILRPYFGIRYFNYSSVLASLKGFSSAGVLVYALDEESPARRAGLRAGDYITQIDGSNLNSTSFERLVNQHQITEARFTIIRDRQQQEIKFNVEAK